MREKSKVLVTGDLGFIGSHLRRRLEEEGFDVRGWDLARGQDIRLIKKEDLEGIDYVFHLAAQAKISTSIEKPLFTHSHNVNGTLNLLSAAKEAGVKRVIYSASSSAYGDQESLSLHEDLKPNPMSPYGVQKLIGEYYCKTFSEHYGLETISLRYFNVYGEDMPDDSPYSAVIAIFLKQKKEGKPLTLFGGKQTRDFTYIGDVVEANYLAMTNGLGNGEIINIGTGMNYSIEDIAKAISDNIRYLPQRENEAMDSQADNTKAKEFLNWSPMVDVIQWLKDLNKS